MRDIEDYTKKYIEPDFEEYQVKYRRKKILEILKQYYPQKVLEIGCGMEPLFSYADWNYQNWIIVEPSDMFYRNARQIVSDQKKENCVQIYQDLFPSHTIDGMQFDFVVCSGLLHEVENIEGFLNAIAGVCGESTVVHINVPNADSFHRILAQNMKLLEDTHEFSERNRQLQQQRVFDMGSLKAEVEKAGFSVCESGSYFIKPFTHAQMFRMMEEHIIGEDVLDGLYEMGECFSEFGSEIYVNVKLK